MGIGTSTPHPSAIVHLGDDQGKGFKIPYTDTSAVIAFANSFQPPVPIANGLLIFQKNVETFYYYDAPKNKWIPLSGITGPTGPKGPTGPTGVTGVTGHFSRMRSGLGFPSLMAGDTCGSYYIDLQNARLFRLKCPQKQWIWRGGPYDNNTRGGYTDFKSSTQEKKQAQPSSSLGIFYERIDNLIDTVLPSFGRKAYVFVQAHGTVKKVTPNNDYNYARFRFKINNTFPNTVQTVSMGPNSKSTEQSADNVEWFISYVFETISTSVIEVQGGQLFSNSANDSIVLYGGPGSINQAHMSVFVMYSREP